MARNRESHPTPKHQDASNAKGLDFAKYFQPVRDVLSQPVPFLNPSAPDAAIAITATTLLDEQLKMGLILKFRRSVVSKTDVNTLFNHRGPLATFSAKINLASMLGIVPDEKAQAELNIMRDVRNAFCHTLKDRSFSDDDIQRKCAALAYSNETPIGTQTDAELSQSQFRPIAKAKFVNSTFYLLRLICISLLEAYEELCWASEHRDELRDKAQAVFDEKFRELAARVVDDLGLAK